MSSRVSPTPGREPWAQTASAAGGRRAAAVVWPLVGRDEECAFVGGVLSEGSAGGVVLSGEAGVGKSRLAHAAAEAAAAAGCAVHWVRATRSAATLPLGAFAPLFPPEAAVGGAGLLAGVRRALAALAGGRRLALCVDDAHLLDEGSAALVHQLVAAGEAVVVVTVRSGEPVPDAVRALWKDDLRALHELTRLGEPTVTASRLAAVADRVDGPFAGIAAAHAAALLVRDGGALIDVAERFVAQGAVLVAAEASAAAAAAHREAGREASARAAAARTAVLLEDCEGARPPTVPGPGLADELTRREREIAVLAASGLSSRQIADRLVVSVRTVDNHLQRAYRKLGISSRDELAGRVTAPE